jgi:hypothetical protein
VSPVKYELGFYIPEDDILHSHCRENLKSYLQISVWIVLSVVWCDAVSVATSNDCYFVTITITDTSTEAEFVNARGTSAGKKPNLYSSNPPTPAD